MPLVSTDTLVYRPDQAALSVHNRRVATQNGWVWDRDFQSWRDRDKFLIDHLGNTPTPIESCK